MKQEFEHIRESIERRYGRQVIFGLHLSVFVFLFAVLGWWVITREPVPGDMQHMWLMAAWFAGLVAHGFIVRVANARDREIEAAWQRGYGGFPPDKAKYGAGGYSSGRLADDGEWGSSFDLETTEKPKRHSWPGKSRVGFEASGAIIRCM